METMKRIAVDKPFPGPVLPYEGAVMGLCSSGLTVQIQMPGLKAGDLKAFKDSFRNYAYLDFDDGTLPIAVWVFMFPRPFNPIDVNFNGRVTKRQYLRNFFNPKEGFKNLLTFYLLDGDILKGIKVVELETMAVTAFHLTIKKQLAIQYTQAEFDQALSKVYAYNTQQLYEMGDKYAKHG